jgi:hypothetical protein
MLLQIIEPDREEHLPSTFLMLTLFSGGKAARITSKKPMHLKNQTFTSLTKISMETLGEGQGTHWLFLQRTRV